MKRRTNPTSIAIARMWEAAATVLMATARAATVLQVAIVADAVDAPAAVVVTVDAVGAVGVPVAADEIAVAADRAAEDTKASVRSTAI